jgi:hypothetical protein
MYVHRTHISCIFGEGVMQIKDESRKDIIVLDKGTEEAFIGPMGCCIGSFVPFRG